MRSVLSQTGRMFSNRERARLPCGKMSAESVGRSCINCSTFRSHRGHLWWFLRSHLLRCRMSLATGRRTCQMPSKRSLHRASALSKAHVPARHWVHSLLPTGAAVSGMHWLTECSCVCLCRRYVQGANTSKVRLFNLSPDTQSSGMTVGGVAAASNIQYSLGSAWVPVPSTSAAFTFTDSTSKKTLVRKTVTPPAAPLGFTNVLLGLQNGAGDLGVQVVSLVDAPEGGTCHP